MLSLSIPGTAFQWIILPTDALIWFVVFAGIIGFKYALKRAFWQQVASQISGNHKAMFCLRWLIVFILIALSDSIHFKTSQTDIASGLDRLCQKLVENPEQSYSRPLSMRGFTAQMVVDQEGLRMEHPRLLYGGKHLEKDADHIGDVIIKICTALILGLILGSAVGFFLSRSRQDRKGILVFYILLGVIAVEIIYLSQFYHVFGTDKVGNSTLWTALKSIRTAFVIGSLTTFFVTFPAVVLGLLAGYLKGWVDDLVQYLYTTLSSIPNILLISAAMLIVQTKLSGEVAELAADQRMFFLIGFVFKMN